MLIELLASLHTNCENITGANGESLQDEVGNIFDLAHQLPDDTDVERWKKDSNEYLWVKHPDRMGN